MSEELFKSVGGRKIVRAGADPDDPDAAEWNFGVFAKTQEVDDAIRAKPSLHSRFPKLIGKWDGSTTVNHYDAVKKVLGDKADDLIQYQPRGTCGGRSGSGSCDVLQCILIALGKRAKFKRVSHAGVYYFARKLYGMIEGNWQDDNYDGVASGSVPKAMAKYGLVTRDESKDEKWYGQGSDDLACQLGAGMHKDLAKELEELAKDNIITEWSPVNSAQEAADGIAAGGVLVGSDSQGFTMTRDRDGFCQPRGTWHHYHFRVSVGKFNGRKGFGYWQSWGRTTPSGPLLPGHPGNCFGVEWDVQDRCIRKGDYAVIFGFPLWEIEEDKVNVDWGLN
jgi:hypothetical protein